ncbi:uncharacterized protein LOC133357851 [Lethenteron reissneri]|uniref:uncharacterized protein LOC133357851 n=1 Tax=Lethenteron reissneri TaxID=7753 RepID=UPI002AB7E243|nr:uncharacterized protein LOC133357851 [Lethenteron reissneri]
MTVDRRILFVPPLWWHYVESLDQATVSANTWVELESDHEARLQEALARIVVCAVKTQPHPDNLARWLNPSEDDDVSYETNLRYLNAGSPSSARLLAVGSLPPAPGRLPPSEEAQGRRVGARQLLQLQLPRRSPQPDYGGRISVGRSRGGRRSQHAVRRFPRPVGSRFRLPDLRRGGTRGAREPGGRCRGCRRGRCRGYGHAVGVRRSPGRGEGDREAAEAAAQRVGGSLVSLNCEEKRTEHEACGEQRTHGGGCQLNPGVASERSSV